jgi:hypothetical protein
MEQHPDIGQVAFYHKYQNRDGTPKGKPIVQNAYGWTYAQCGMTRKAVGDAAGWCGPEGWISYGWDTRLSLRIWELGYRVVPHQGGAVIDYEYVDETRKKFSTDLRQGQTHPDHVLFQKVWKGRLPDKKNWRSANVNVILSKAQAGTLRTLRFKSAMSAKAPERHTSVDVFSKYGPARLFNHTAFISQHGRPAFQKKALDLVKKWKPDLVLLQAQRPNNIDIPTAREITKRAFTINFDADTHYPLSPFHFAIAKVVDLQVVISPDLFDNYIANGARNLIWWPIGIEHDYLDFERPKGDKKYDVAFLGSLYGEGNFPEAETRKRAVLAVHNDPDLELCLRGYGWPKVGLPRKYTGEAHADCAELYGQSRMALSVSQTADYWGYTSDRLYNITATGCPALVQRFHGMEEHGYIDGETCITWETIPEMLEKAKEYKSNGMGREAIGRRGREMTLERHTWDKRVEELFLLLGGMT